MENNSVHLHQFVAESLHPKTFTGKRIFTSEFEKWKDYINQELRKISTGIFSLTLGSRNNKDDSIIDLFAQITELSNMVNGYLMKYKRLWKDHPEAAAIRHGYMGTCIAFEDVLNKLSRKAPLLLGSMPYTEHAVGRVKVELKFLMNSIEESLVRQGIQPDLLKVLINGLRELINQKNLSRKDDFYLRKLMNELLQKKFNATNVLVDFLIINDFNMPDFFLFCAEGWMEQLADMDGLFEQRETLLNAKSHLFDISLAKGLRFPSSEQRLYNELNKFLGEKYFLVKERIKISRQLTVENRTPHSKRVLINLSVAQLGLFIRLQVEKGVLAKEHIGELFTFFARNFYTPNTDFISPESLQKKSSVVEHATAKKLKTLLIEMLNWLNTNYNLSNYN